MICFVSDPYCASSFDCRPSKSSVNALVSPRSQAKNVYSSSFHPVKSGLLLEMAGAVGSNGCAGRTPPSTTGPKPQGDDSALPPIFRLWCGGTGGNCDWMRSSSAAGTSSNFRQSLGPMLSARKTNAVVSAAISRVSIRTPGPLSIDALEKYGAAAGIAYKQDVFAPPPDSPKIITLFGSPPKTLICVFTHSSAATISRRPWLPEPAYSDPANSSRYRKPSKPKR